MIYFDHAATCGIRPDAVGQAMLSALREASGNPGRSGHRLSLAAARVIEEARDQVASLLHVDDSAHVLLTKNATEATNLVLRGVLRPGDQVLISGWEHNAVVRPLRALERTLGLDLQIIPAAADAPLDLEWLGERLRRGRIRLAALTQVSNVTGRALPLLEAGRLLAAHGCFFLVDAAQGAGVLDLDANLLPADAVALTGHKALLGPQGTGALYLRHPDRVEPLLRGGTGSRSDSEEQPDFPPDRFEAGTPNVPGFAGLSAGIALLRAQGLDRIARRHRELGRILRGRLRRVPGLVLHGADQGEPELAVASFTLAGWDNGALALALERRGLLCRPGLHCAPRAHRTLGTFPQGTVRFSLSSMNTAEEIDQAAGFLEEIAREDAP
jgi:cysteine desulfurase / selenocysteine lyase